MSEVGHFRGRGKSVEFIYKVFGQVSHNINGTPKNKKMIDNLGEPGGTGGSQSPKLTIFGNFRMEIISFFEGYNCLYCN